MIDDLEKSMALVERMQGAFPMQAFTTKRVRGALRQDLKRNYPRECNVTEIKYMGDEGGIMCFLDFGIFNTPNVHIVSITHLQFGRKNPLSREIKAYCKHRIKRLRKLQDAAPI